MGEGVEGEQAGNVVAVEGEGAEAAAAAAVVGVGTGLGIGGEVPEQDIFAPVAADADDDVGDGRLRFMGESALEPPRWSVMDCSVK